MKTTIAACSKMNTFAFTVANGASDYSMKDNVSNSFGTASTDLCAAAKFARIETADYTVTVKRKANGTAVGTGKSVTSSRPLVLNNITIEDLLFSNASGSTANVTVDLVAE